MFAKKMRQKIEAAFFVLAAAVLILPSVALAQWSQGEANVSASGLPDKPIYTIIGSLVNWLLGIFGFIAVIGFVISGIQYLTAAGNDAQIETAKENMKYSIIGVIVALSGAVIIFAIDNLLSGVDSF